MRVLLDPDSVTRGLRRVAGEIIERHRGTDGLVLVGVRRGGVPVAKRIAEWVHQLEQKHIPVGSVDITL
jgi:pyrimidine operon attenuation protein/uracil phosphoribosyltransferase